MWRDKSPGVKILWIWTIGTAAVLVTNVARTRMRDMEQLINSQSQEQEQQQQNPRIIDSVITDQPSDPAFEAIREEKS
ncbi:uncharacterized protein LOC113783659 [Coffea eugenioides]|uniref:uncharacterized protein LOC113783659 n=1 Tax=Coffea eugenioides TaxID=49369 RepID=UPI000F60EDF0|nr:uncharacterized protein LOC113783659 [Coffea eugenioides]